MNWLIAKLSSGLQEGKGIKEARSIRIRGRDIFESAYFKAAS
ncbi:hypothetical protein [Paenibacillus sp. FSL P4-0081]|nr:hypothetical protein [Paenibacillus sp. FSL P4-0081]